jgi:4-hydroxy-3-methylbut-2-enyl diphosphate reductase
MKITLSQYAGFCDGVRRAYEMVSALDMARAKRPVYILGTLVHNPNVNEKIEVKGIEKIEREEFFAAKAGEIGTIIITAHGTGPDVYAHARKIGAEILDATCPKVIKVQRLAQVYKKRNYQIVIVGDRGHKEVRGIDDWGGGGAVIISDAADLKNIKLDPEEKIAVLAQTTQNEEFFRSAGVYLKKKYPSVEILATTCHTTHERQEEIKNLARSHDAVIVIGSNTSANSGRLFEIARKINPRTYFIENAAELANVKFDGAEKVAVTAGASAPGWVIEEVMEYITRNT